ncbi:MAG: cytochrome b/b6 domain-containing protein [Pseudomonadota bacterium]
MTATDRHGLALRLVHWTTAGLVLAQFMLAMLNCLLYEPRPVFAEWAIQTHMSLGAMLFLLTVGRLALRVFWPGQFASPMTSGLPRLARSVQVLLYICLLTLPVFGYIRLAALGFEPGVFGLVMLPALAVDIDLATFAATAHAAFSVALLMCLILHTTGALLHRYLFSRSALARMAFEAR